MQDFLSRWMPIDISAHGYQIDRIISMVHWLMAVLFVGWALYFLYVLYRFRAGKNPEASYEGAKSHFSSYVEVGVAALEAVLLIGFAIPAWSSWVNAPAADERPFEVRVVGEQFAWNVHYPGPDGIFGRAEVGLVDTVSNPLGIDRSDPYAADDVTTINQLHLPVDREVVVYLSSKDVIHGFFLPQLRVKQDAIPGMRIPVHFRATQTTPEESQYPACNAEKNCWEIACSQLCGLGHFRMRGFYTVHTAEGFEAWMNEQVASLPSFSPRVASATPGAAALPGRIPDLPRDSSDVDTLAGSAQ